jgi:hypothetical protein
MNKIMFSIPLALLVWTSEFSKEKHFYQMTPQLTSLRWKQRLPHDHFGFFMVVNQQRVSIARHWWLTSVILAIKKADSRRITVQSQPRKIVCKTLLQKLPSSKGWQSGSRWRLWVQAKVLKKKKRMDIIEMIDPGLPREIWLTATQWNGKEFIWSAS